MMKYDPSIPIFARLLAREGLRIDIGNHPTAMFDLKNRVLMLPNWVGLTMEQQEMLIGHEVGHALLTDPTPLNQHPLCKPFVVDDQIPPGLFQIFNLVEDARIEKLMLRQYPGFRPTFVSAYFSFHDVDFFGLADRDPKTIPFLDRVNLHFKLGVSGALEIGITFTPEEQAIIDRIAEIETWDEVVAMSVELYKQELQKGQETVVVVSQMTLAEKLGQMIEPDNERSGIKRVPAKMPTSLMPWPTTGDTEPGRSTMHHARPIANMMYSQFLRRQKAHVYAHTRIHKTGSVDTRRLSRHQINEDVFRRRTLLPVGKRHGFVFLVDCSGSMEQVLPSVWRQVATLVAFAKAARIPFDVFAFSTLRHQSKLIKPSVGEFVAQAADIWTSRVLSSFDSYTQMSSALSVAISSKFETHLPLGNTPLNSASLALMGIVKNFKEHHNVERMSVIYLTDGNDTDELAVAGSASHIYDDKTGYLSKSLARGDMFAQILTLMKRRLQCTMLIWYLYENDSEKRQVTKDFDLRGISSAVDGTLFLDKDDLITSRNYAQLMRRFVDLIA